LQEMRLLSHCFFSSENLFFYCCLSDNMWEVLWL